MSGRVRPAALVTITLAALAATVGTALGEGSPRMPGPATASYERGARERDDAACTRCHGSIAREHEASLHARSFTDESFQKGYAIEPEAFCRSCHAPESKPDAQPDAFARTHGVSCVSCHAPSGAANGAVLASPSTRASSAPHAITRVPDFGTRACTSCHDFAFPGAEAHGEKGRMQKTAREHAASPDRDRSCASCHMTRGEGHAAHGFAVASDRTLLASALDVLAARDPDGRARFVVSARGVGHAFPTGDLFRRLVLRVKTPRGPIEHAFERRFRAERDASGAPVRFETVDTRLSPSRTVVLAAPAGSTWEVVYQRVTAVAQTPPFAATVESEMVLSKGSL